MYQAFLQINLPIFPIDIQQISRKTTSHYLNIQVTNQNIRYLIVVFHFGTRYYPTIRKNSKNREIKLKSKLLRMDDEVKYF